MEHIYQQQFLQQRIDEIGSALFHNQSSAVLRLPSAIVTSLTADDCGCVWFVLEKPTQNIAEFEQEFPVKMDFYRKGTGCFLQAVGRGFIVTDPEEMHSIAALPQSMRDALSGNNILVKMKLQQASYRESRSLHKINWWQQAWGMMTMWFRQNTLRPRSIFYPAS